MSFSKEMSSFFRLLEVSWRKFIFRQSRIEPYIELSFTPSVGYNAYKKRALTHGRMSVVITRNHYGILRENLADQALNDSLTMYKALRLFTGVGEEMINTLNAAYVVNTLPSGNTSNTELVGNTFSAMQAVGLLRDHPAMFYRMEDVDYGDGLKPNIMITFLY